MRHPVVLLDLQTAMRSAEIGVSYREPTHPAVIATGFGKGQCLAHLGLMTQTTGAVVTFDHAGVDLRVTQRIQPVLKTRFAMHRSHVNMITPTAFVTLFDVTIGQILAPA